MVNTAHDIPAMLDLFLYPLMITVSNVTSDNTAH